MVLLSLFVSTALANEIIVPEFAADDPASVAGAEIVYAAMVEALGDRDLAFLDSDDLATFLGGRAENCVQQPGCPENLWMDIEGELAIMGTVTLSGDTINAGVEYHRRGHSGAIEVFQAEFSTEEAGRFAVDAALIAEDLLQMGDKAIAAAGATPLGVAGATALTQDALGPIAPESADDPQDYHEPASEDLLGPIERDEGTEETFVERPVAEPETTEEPSIRISEVEMDEAQERRYMGLTKNLYEEFKASGKSRGAFLTEKKYRAKTFFVELAPGMVFGDVQRRYTAIAYIQEGASPQYYERDQFLPGTAFSLVAGFGYAPTWWLELGLNVGLEFPKKDFISGYEAYDGQEDFRDGANCPEYCDLVAFKPATALTFLLEPRARFIMRPTGLVKPYAVAGWATRFYDGYDTPDTTTVSFPNRSGAQTFGPLGGLGLGFDPRKKASAYLEGTYTHLLGPGIHDVNISVINQPPTKVAGNNSVFVVRAGVVSRF